MTTSDQFTELVKSLAERNIRFVMIGVWGANYYAQHGGHIFATDDRDFFFPPDPNNLVNAWSASSELGYELWSGNEPLGEPLDLWLAERVVSNRANTTAIHPAGIIIDFTLVMAGFEFDDVWSKRKIFRIDDVDVPVARLSHIVESKAKADRLKDRLFLATWEEALRHLLKNEE